MEKIALKIANFFIRHYGRYLIVSLVSRNGHQYIFCTMNGMYRQLGDSYTFNQILDRERLSIDECPFCYSDNVSN